MLSDKNDNVLFSLTVDKLASQTVIILMVCYVY